MELGQTSKPDALAVTLEKIVKMLAKTAGRDKVIRFWQYLSLFIAYTKLDGGEKKKDLENPRWITAFNTLRSVRKVLRFLRTMQYSRKIMATIKEMRSGPKQSGMDLSINISSILSNLGTLFFYLFDHRVFLAETGLIDQSTMKRNFHFSYLCWFCECFFAVIRDLLVLSQMKSSSSRLQGDKKHMQSQVSYLSLDILKNIGDCLVAASYIHGNLINQQQVGILGTVTSAIAVYQMLRE